MLPDKFTGIQVVSFTKNTARHGCEELLAKAISEWLFNGEVGTLDITVMTEGGGRRKATMTLPKLPKRENGNQEVASGTVRIQVEEIT